MQLTANGGVLVIDDFGRQKGSPVALLNRWITPLESRIDYLTLQTGQKLPMPFVVLVVFATNISPSDLVDEAFLRRIRYKVFAESPTVAEFKEIFERCCAHQGVLYEEVAGRRPAGEPVPAAADLAARLPSARSRSVRRCRSAIHGPARHPHRPRCSKAAFHTYFVDEHGESLVPG